jgi:hypothetical protein
VFSRLTCLLLGTATVALPQGIITTIAGTALGVAVDADGNLFIADPCRPEHAALLPGDACKLEFLDE